MASGRLKAATCHFPDDGRLIEVLLYIYMITIGQTEEVFPSETETVQLYVHFHGI